LWILALFPDPLDAQRLPFALLTFAVDATGDISSKDKRLALESVRILTADLDL
jgi:hypothetical protein